MKINQILPDFVLEEIPLQKALCMRTEKKNTGEIMKFLKSYCIDYEKSYFLFDKKQAIKSKNKQDSFKYGKYNLKNKNLIVKDQEKIKLENFDFENCDSNVYEVRDISFLKRAKANESNKDENLIFLSFYDNIEYLKEFNNKDFIGDLKNFISEKLLLLKDPFETTTKTYQNSESENINNQVLFYKDIPSIQPTTQAQIEYCKKHWSILIHPSIYSKLIYLHSEKEKEIILNVFLKLKELKSNLNFQIESILFDPVKETIVAQAGADEANFFVLNIKHSVLKCIDNFCLTLTEDFILNKNMNLNLLGDKEIIQKLKSGEKEEENFFKQKEKEDNQKDYNKELNHEFDKLDQYYCQGLYLFTWKEPCFMCCMALVHSRIERVYFVEYNEIDGALASLIKLNSYNLNHNFCIFKMSE